MQEKAKLQETVEAKIAEWRIASGNLTTFWQSSDRTKDGYVAARDQVVKAHAVLVGIDTVLTTLNILYFLTDDQRKVLRNL
jgi:hypothetical protein